MVTKLRHHHRWLLVTSIAALLAGWAFCANRNSKEKTMETKVMESTLAGAWYPAKPQTLTQQLQACFDKAEVQTRQDVIALISPHAGYTYSGPCAAMGMKVADRSYKRVVVIGPSHRTMMRNQFSVPQAAAFETPLGKIPLDTAFINTLLEQPIFVSMAQAFHGENSIELQLPLLQHRYKDFTLVPIAAGQCDWQTIQKAAHILRGLVDDDTLIVASGDFTHYGPNFGYVPFTDDIPENLKQLDMGAWEYIEKRDAQGFLAYLQKTGATICGRISFAVVLAMLGSNTEAHLINYQTSGQQTGDFGNSVSYVSAAFTGSWSKPAQQTEEASTPPATLSDQDKEVLLTLARKTVAFAVEKQRVPTPEDLNVEIPASAQAERAAFVTLHKGRHLRGCIGEIFPSQMLYLSIIKNAVNAALHDPRFPGVTPQEVGELHLEISALTPPATVASWKDIRIGIDGMVVKKGGRSAVFLPQVAPEQGWDLETTLTYLSQKAGLAPDAWREGAEFLTFQADVFGEKR